MAVDEKITELDVVTQQKTTDLFALVTDMDSTPVTKYIEGHDLFNGWIGIVAGLTYVSSDDPTYVIQANADMSAILSVGMKLWFQNDGGNVFGIIHAIGAYGGGTQDITMYGGTDYDVANSAITAPFYSTAKAPFGFPLDPTKWSIVITDTSSTDQSTPTQNQWYNINSVSIDIPIGSWHARYDATGRIANDSATVLGLEATLSTTNNGETNSVWTSQNAISLPSGDLVNYVNFFASRVITISTKDIYYLNWMTNLPGIDSIGIRTLQELTVVCAYL